MTGTYACPVCKQDHPHSRTDPVHAYAAALQKEVDELKHDLRRCMGRDLAHLNP